ncbi:hypothetical protein [Bacillus wiedmannii]|uniref:hypothetical protein n=1 Tax=Bacillus wiedmannii TaxID=1890302 RepID=UPI000BF108B1|nr:hypothetical protein [Bacillus wiedmannii]PEL91398.1 hypothetical protein CN626_14335 [Bacillus wiedmannii]
MNSNIFISNITTFVPNSCKIQKNDLINQDSIIKKFESQKRKFPLYSMNKEYGLDNNYDGKNAQFIIPNISLPISLNQTSSDLALEATKKLVDKTSKRSPLYFAYCHDTNEPSIYLTPALKVKKKLKLKGSIPFSISHQGSAAFTSSIFLLDTLHKQNSKETFSIITTTDQVCPPHPRIFFTAYPKGDSSASCIFSTDNGQYRIIDYTLHTFSSTPTPLRWSITDYCLFEEKLISITSKLLDEFINTNSIKWIIAQNLSKYFIEALEMYTQKNELKLFKRTIATSSNLLTSDCLVSLEQAEQSGVLDTNDNILLLQVGPLSHIGLLLLKKERADNFVYLK